ncbi:MAG: hypothetical protein NTV68_04240 [Methanomicrobiales archaeon]|jgi:hypothetical protein|nr:hypothetical protein [Methanomicrobiales archaeon]
MAHSRIVKAAVITLLAFVTISIAVSAAPIGGNQGWYKVICNVDGATVFFDSTYEGAISAGSLTVPVYTTGTPFKTYTVQKDGYTTYTGNMIGVPAIGETLDLYATLNPVVPTTPAVIGGSQGWYQVNCNVNGAQVTFDNTVVGTIAQGSLTVPVYVTGTPYKTYSVSMPGYVTYTSPVTAYPAAGETVQLYATLNPQPTTTPTTKPSPVGIEVALGALVIAGACGILFRRT